MIDDDPEVASRIFARTSLPSGELNTLTIWASLLSCFLMRRSSACTRLLNGSSFPSGPERRVSPRVPIVPLNSIV